MTLLTPPDGIRKWVAQFRVGSSGPVQLNVWIPDPTPHRDAAHEARLRVFLERWGPPVPASAGDTPLPSFDAQCDAFLECAPTVVSSIMGVFPTAVVSRFHAAGISWFATATTLAEARIARDAGADAIVAQGYPVFAARASDPE